MRVWGRKVPQPPKNAAREPHQAKNHDKIEQEENKVFFFPHTYACLIYTHRFEYLSRFALFRSLTHGLAPYLWIMYVKPDVCRQLLSESPRNRHPCSWLCDSPPLWLNRGLHSSDYAHAKHTKIKGKPISELPSFMYPFPLRGGAEGSISPRPFCLH